MLPVWAGEGRRADATNGVITDAAIVSTSASPSSESRSVRQRRTSGEDYGCMEESHRGSPSERTVPAAVDAALGAAAMATNAAASVARLLARASAPVGRRVMHPPLLNESLHPARVVDALASWGHIARTSTGADLSRVIAAVVPPVVDEV